MAISNHRWNYRKKTVRTFIVGVVVLAVMSGSTPALAAGKDDVFISKLRAAVDASIQAVAGSKLDVGPTGREIASGALQDAENLSDIIAESKNVCKQLNAASKRGPRAVRAKAVQMAKQDGVKWQKSLNRLDSESDRSEEEKFSIGMVVGMIKSAEFRHGLEVYCPKHAKHATSMSQAWVAGLTG